MLKQTRETNIEGREKSNTCIYENSKFMLCFPEVATNYDRDCSLSSTRL